MSKATGVIRQAYSTKHMAERSVAEADVPTITHALHAKSGRDKMRQTHLGAGSESPTAGEATTTQAGFQTAV